MYIRPTVKGVAPAIDEPPMLAPATLPVTALKANDIVMTATTGDLSSDENVLAITLADDVMDDDCTRADGGGHGL